MITQTIVFEFDDQEQRKATLDQFEGLLLAESGPRITGLSVDDELHRCRLMTEALERFDDHYDLREAIAALADASDLKNWSWEKYEAEAV